MAKDDPSEPIGSRNFQNQDRSRSRLETRSNLKLPPNSAADDQVKELQTQLRVIGLSDAFKGEENYSWLNSLSGGGPRLLKVEENLRIFEEEIANRLIMMQQTF